MKLNFETERSETENSETRRAKRLASRRLLVAVEVCSAGRKRSCIQKSRKETKTYNEKDKAAERVSGSFRCNEAMLGD